MKRLSNVKSPKKATKRPRQTENAENAPSHPTENPATSDFEGDSSSSEGILERWSPPIQHPEAPVSASTPVRRQDNSGKRFIIGMYAVIHT